jgi:hypothetical protein
VSCQILYSQIPNSRLFTGLCELHKDESTRFNSFLSPKRPFNTGVEVGQSLAFIQAVLNRFNPRCAMNIHLIIKYRSNDEMEEARYTHDCFHMKECVCEGRQVLLLVLRCHGFLQIEDGVLLPSCSVGHDVIAHFNFEK